MKNEVQCEIRKAGKCGSAWWWVVSVPALGLTVGEVVAKDRETAIKKAQKELRL